MTEAKYPVNVVDVLMPETKMIVTVTGVKSLRLRAWLVVRILKLTARILNCRLDVSLQ